MKRPSDQAKLLFFAFLRSTVSAIATSESKLGNSVLPYSVVTGSLAGNHLHDHLTAAQQQQEQQQQDEHARLTGVTGGVVGLPQITLRLARRTDVPSIQRCNLATLPENYNQQFYSNHLREWPELALVAEYIDNTDTRVTELSSVSSLYNAYPAQAKEAEPNIVAYVLGKVENKPVSLLDDEEAFRENPYKSHAVRYTTERLGHVTSLAVSEDFRRQGLARDLMLQLHYHLKTCYSVDTVGLHVRQSNLAAAGLYEGFGYEEEEMIPNYYQDGEDAYFMKKRFQGEKNLKPHEQGFFRSLRRSKPWETAPDDLKLPRRVGRRAAAAIQEEEEQRQQQEEETASSSSSSSSPELLTGTSW
jgi:ribosomal protein S18 acetylase RimI-like enzyme